MAWNLIMTPLVGTHIVHLEIYLTVKRQDVFLSKPIPSKPLNGSIPADMDSNKKHVFLLDLYWCPF